MQEHDELVGTQADVADPNLELLKVQQDLEFQAKMRQFNMIGELSNWRRNMKNNTRRSQILTGHNKIMSICFGKV